MIYNVTHKTIYSYTDPVSLCHNLVHLRPRVAPRQECHFSHLQVQPEPRTVVQYNDYFGNPVTFFTIQEPHRELAITAEHRLEVAPAAAPNLQESLPWEIERDMLQADRSEAMLDAFQFTLDSAHIVRNKNLAAYAESSFALGRPLLEAVRELTERIHNDFHYDTQATSVATPLSEVLIRRRGVCQDFAHLQIGCLRSLGLAARYVSGYIQSRGPAESEGLIGADASHAWVSVFCFKSGWTDFDPTNNSLPSEQHLTIAWGRDYDDISPVKGVILGGSTNSMSVAVNVCAQA
jgi:transglutaminase-like putative cysteine protease